VPTKAKIGRAYGYARHKIKLHKIYRKLPLTGKCVGQHRLFGFLRVSFTQLTQLFLHMLSILNKYCMTSISSLPANISSLLTSFSSLLAINQVQQVYNITS